MRPRAGTMIASRGGWPLPLGPAYVVVAGGCAGGMSLDRFDRSLRYIRSLTPTPSRRSTLESLAPSARGSDCGDAPTFFEKRARVTRPAHTAASVWRPSRRRRCESRPVLQNRRGRGTAALLALGIRTAPIGPSSLRPLSDAHSLAKVGPRIPRSIRARFVLRRRAAPVEPVETHTSDIASPAAPPHGRQCPPDA
jgi:hypothetical protein